MPAVAQAAGVWSTTGSQLRALRAGTYVLKVAGGAGPALSATFSLR